MNRVIVIPFDTETKAYEGQKALIDLDSEGSIGVYGWTVLYKNHEGATTIKKESDAGPLGTAIGTTLGTIVGLFAGPVGAAVGASAGFVSGSAIDLHNFRVGEDFIADVAKVVTPGKYALVADIEEDWTTPLDLRIEALGSTVHRRALSEVKHTIHEENVAAMKADLAQIKAEAAQARADRKAKLHEKINHLESKIQAQLQKNKERRDAAERQAIAKVQALKAKAAAASAKAS